MPCRFISSDIDECFLSFNKCNHMCTNTPGSYTCSCQQGYTFDPDDLLCRGKCNIRITNEILHLQNLEMPTKKKNNIMSTNPCSSPNISLVYMPSTKLKALLLLSFQSNVHSTSSISLIPTETNQYLQTVLYWAPLRWKST